MEGVPPAHRQVASCATCRAWQTLHPCAAAPVGAVTDPHHQPASFARRLGRPGIGSQQPVAEAAGDRGTADVLLVAADEHASYAVETERDIGERRAGTCGKTAAFRIGTD